MFKLGTRLIKSAKQARVYARGELAKGSSRMSPTISTSRRCAGGSDIRKQNFRGASDFAIDAVQEWEQRRRTPDRTARILLKVIEREPEAVTRALGD